MPDTYYFAFQLNGVEKAPARYEEVMNVIIDVTSGKWWVELPSFIVFDSDLDSATLVRRLTAVLDTRVDVAVLGMTDYKQFLILGASTDDDILDLVPNARRPCGERR